MNNDILELLGSLLENYDLSLQDTIEIERLIGKIQDTIEK